MKPIGDVARAIGIDPAALEPYGHYKAKLPLSAFKGRPNRGKLVLVSAITPTPAGEGKTTTTIGLVQGLTKIGVRSAAALREPSLGPVFGMKGGGAGGGASEMLPMMDINLHFNGDFHAVSSAHNLLAALVDNALHNGNPSRLDPRRVTWKRVVDMNDRALRDIVIGLGGRSEGIPRESGFDITAASEVMAILCLASDIPDLKARLGRIVVGYTSDGVAVTAGQLGAVGAMAALLSQAIKPNLVQTTEGVAGVRARRPVRQHRSRHQQHHGHARGAVVRRHRRDRGRLRVRTRRGEVLRHQLPLRRIRASLHGAGDDDPCPQDARRQAARRR